MTAFLLMLWNLPRAAKIGIAILIVLLVSVGVVAYLSHKAAEAEAAAKAAQIEANRQKQKAEGMGIIVNAGNTAQEVQNGKITANQQAINSNLSNTDYSNSVRRDSGTFSNDIGTVSARFCRNFPDDPKCRKR